MRIYAELRRFVRICVVLLIFNEISIDLGRFSKIEKDLGGLRFRELGMI